MNLNLKNYPHSNLKKIHHNVKDNLLTLLDTENRGSNSDQQLLVLETLVDKIKKNNIGHNNEEEDNNDNNKSVRVLKNHLSLEDVEYLATKNITVRFYFLHLTFFSVLRLSIFNLRFYALTFYDL